MTVDWNKVIESVNTIYTDWINAEPIDYWKDIKLHELDALKKDRNRTNRTPIKKNIKQQNATL
jgi:hypothetical protein